MFHDYHTSATKPLLLQKLTTDNELHNLL